MRRTFLLSGAVLAAMLSHMAPAHAGYVSGTQLAALCRANIGERGHDIEAAECLGYIVGVADSFDCADPLRGFHWDRQQQQSQVKLVTAVLRWLEAHPSARREDAAGTVAAALAEAFPCSQ